MSRLLFAAARGARVEMLNPFNKWCPCVDVGKLRWRPEKCRIHPKHKHLQYGPISTALRDRVLLDDPWVEGFVAALAYVDKALGCSPVTADYVDYEMSLLIVAESLADEGL